MQLTGLHHITAITGNAPLNVSFYTNVLGLRLVKKTVNQDDVSAYHLYYGDATGKPGFDITFFDWPLAGPNRPGVGAVSAIAFGVNGQEALEWWIERLNSFKVEHSGLQTRGTQNVVTFRDPEGQSLELIDVSGRLQSTYWKESTVPENVALQGFSYVRMIERTLNPTASFLTDTLGFRQTGSYQSAEGTTVYIFETGEGGPGTEVHIDIRPNAPSTRQGIGGVHHVAFRTPTDEEQEQWHEKISQKTRQISSIIDRFYFHSIYFREPGGVLFEIATDEPGFAVDEDPEHLGEMLALPPFLEPHRKEIEAQLRPLHSKSQS
jgi:glyoxalase family protein